ncbi:MAG: hypothetical protein KDE62_06375 [Calditrichaeota bacterium]|nr:hypothetical protein [Calditrichota bacterium]
MILQCFQRVQIPLQFLLAKAVVKIGVTGAAKQDNPRMHFFPRESLFIPLILVAGAWYQVVPGKAPHLAAAQGACGGVSIQFSAISFQFFIL